MKESTRSTPSVGISYMMLDSLDWLSEYSNVKTGNLFNSYIQVIFILAGQGFSQHNFFGAQSHELFHFFMP